MPEMSRLEGMQKLDMVMKGLEINVYGVRDSVTLTCLHYIEPVMRRVHFRVQELEAATLCPAHFGFEILPQSLLSHDSCLPGGNPIQARSSAAGATEPATVA